MRDFNDRARPPPDFKKDLPQLVRELSPRHNPWQVFADFVEMAAISVSSAVDLTQRAAREERYLQVAGRYERHEIEIFPRMLASLVMALEAEMADALGRAFHDLELHNKWTGQYFTPDPICRMIAKMTIVSREDLEAKIADRGFVTAQEPAVGSGAMVIALAHEMHEAGVNYQQHLHVTAVDIDVKCVHMAYLQFALLHIPATVVHGNSLTLEEHERWYTPAHIIGGWNWKLKRKEEPDEPHPITPAPHNQAPTKENDEPPGPSQLTLF